MSSRTSMRLAAAGALAITLAVLPAFASAASDRYAVTTELSAQNNPNNKNKNKNQPQNQQQKQQVQQQKFQQKQQVKQQKQQVQQQKFQQKQQSKQQKNQLQLQKGQQKIQVQQQKNQLQQLKGQNKTVKVFVPKGANAKVVTGVKIKGLSPHGANKFVIRGHNYSAWRGGYRKRHGNGWRTFVALSALGVLAIGATQYYPYAYIDSPADYCEGLTEDGCQLDWQDVETVEGDVVGQCVAYCPWQ